MERRRQQEMLRKKEQRKRARQTFVSRAVVFLIILGILAAAAAAVFFLHFNKTDPEPQPSTVTYSYGGEEMDPLPEEEAIRGGVWYIDFHDVAGYLGMRIVGGADSMRYVITDSADAEGDGGEEDVVFFADSDAAEVNGQSIRLEGKAILEGDHYLVPCSFIETYMQGVRVTVSGGTVAVARTYTGDVQDALSFTLKDAGAIEPLPEDSEAVPGEIVTPPAEEDLTVTFQSDLSAYEEYMNPADRDGYLILVNNQNTVDESHKPDDLTDLVDTRKDGRNTQKMRLYAARALEAMFIELRASGYTDVSVTSAYRSYTYQNSLFNTYTSNEMAKNPSLTLAEAQAITATYSARPGTSEHQTGLCCDMHNLGAADVAFANKAAYAWLKENCWKFGFIIRFPEGKEEITGISFEPWHYRYVGRYHAKAIYDSGLCLEEYLASIQ